MSLQVRKQVCMRLRLLRLRELLLTCKAVPLLLLLLLLLLQQQLMVMLMQHSSHELRSATYSKG
jgi:hypothetical protein